MIGLNKLEFVFELNTSAIDVWSTISGLLKNRGSWKPSARLNDEDVSTESIDEEIKKKGVNAFRVEIGEFSFFFNSISSFSHCLLEVKEKMPDSLPPWDEWVSALLSCCSPLQVWVSDIEYSYWQSAEDPLEYESSGKSFVGLPLISNGLPPPLERKVIDISKNPSRRLIKDGYVESIGGTMWLSSRFFEFVGKDKLTFLRSEGCVSVMDFGGMIKITVGDGLFKDSSTVSLQQRLRDLLYGAAPA